MLRRQPQTPGTNPGPLQLAGVFTTLVTPFRHGHLDEPALVQLVKRQIDAGVAGLIVGSGVAGEAATLSIGEQDRVIELCVAAAGAGVIVIAEAFSNATSTTIDRVTSARILGAHAALVSCPWYNRPSQEGVYQHYLAVSEATNIPILVGVSPQRAALGITPDTLSRLASVPRIVGSLEDSGEAGRVSTIRHACGPGWAILAGNDASALGFFAHGAQGCASLVANVAPNAMVAMHDAFQRNEGAMALAWHDRLWALQRLLAQDPQPAWTKLALTSLGLCLPDVRLPITRFGFGESKPLLAAMQACGLEAPCRAISGLDADRRQSDVRIRDGDIAEAQFLRPRGP